jgi:hypothetical protein
MEPTATNGLGQVRLLEDVHSGGPKNHMKQGEIRDIIPSPVARIKSYTWVQGPQAAVRLLPGEYEKI